MRLGVIDVGSNTVTLLVVDAHHGAPPLPLVDPTREPLKLAEQISKKDGSLSKAGADALVRTCDHMRKRALDLHVDELLAFATSAVRDATNRQAVVRRVRDEAGVDLKVLKGENEARLTFLAARRWFGWSAGKLLVLDIGGGSLEVAAGQEERPSVAYSLQLGAGRLTRDWFRHDPPEPEEIAKLESHVDSLLGQADTDIKFDIAAATSRTFRSLARLAGAAPSGAGLWAPRTLTRTGLHMVRGFIQRIPWKSLADLDGVSSTRAHQLVAGAVVADRAMHRMHIDELRICPWALREGVILWRLDQLGPSSLDQLGTS